MGSITDFITGIKGEVARPKLFEVTITFPSKFRAELSIFPYLSSVENSLKLKCESTNIPGRTFATTEQKFGSNPAEKHAYHTTYNDIDLTFIVTEENASGRGLKEKQVFDKWMNWINPIDSYDFRYKEDYVGEIFIYQLDGSGEKIFTSTLLEAFPISVNQLDLDWSSDGYHKLNVTFAYTKWF
jgi:hypothetical protein